jgi:PrkA serine protein kinase-like protein
MKRSGHTEGSWSSPLGLFAPEEYVGVLESEYGIPRRYLTGIMSPWAITAGQLSPRRLASPLRARPSRQVRACRVRGPSDSVQRAGKTRRCRGLHTRPVDVLGVIDQPTRSLWPFGVPEAQNRLAAPQYVLLSQVHPSSCDSRSLACASRRVGQPEGRITEARRSRSMMRTTPFPHFDLEPATSAAPPRRCDPQLLSSGRLRAGPTKCGADCGVYCRTLASPRAFASSITGSASQSRPSCGRPSPKHSCYHPTGAVQRQYIDRELEVR